MNDPVLRLPPHSTDAEHAVLGGLMLDPDAIDRVADIVAESDFYLGSHRVIYRCITRMAHAAKPVDALTLIDELTATGAIEDAGGPSYIGNMAQSVPTAANVVSYAKIVRDRAMLRELAGVSARISESAYLPAGRPAEEVINEAEAAVFAITERGASATHGLRAARDIAPGVMERIEELHANPREVTGLATGFSDLDRITSGLQAGDLVVVAARPSMGKTAFALNIAEHAALKLGKAVAVFSMEMNSQQVVGRMAGSIGGIDAQRLRTGQLHDNEWSKLTTAWGKLNEAELYIDDTPALSPIELRSRARRLHRQVGGPGLGLIVVDYLQLMSSKSGKDENRAQEISEISRSLKTLAKELAVPVVALSQLNRSLEQRPNKRPIMSDLRESGAIEQDADLILFIYRDEVYNAETEDKNIAEIIIGKQRNGPIGTVRLTFLGASIKFANAEMRGLSSW